MFKGFVADKGDLTNFISGKNSAMKSTNDERLDVTQLWELTEVKLSRSKRFLKYFLPVHVST